MWQILQRPGWSQVEDWWIDQKVFSNPPGETCTRDKEGFKMDQRRAGHPDLQTSSETG